MRGKDAAVDLEGKSVTVVALEKFDINVVKSAIIAAGFEVIA